MLLRPLGLFMDSHPMKTRSELGLCIEREREGEERNDWKVKEKVMGSDNLWLPYRVRRK